MAHDPLAGDDFEQAMTTLLVRLERVKSLVDEARQLSATPGPEQPVQAPRR